MNICLLIIQASLKYSISIDALLMYLNKLIQDQSTYSYHSATLTYDDIQ